MDQAFYASGKLRGDGDAMHMLRVFGGLGQNFFVSFGPYNGLAIKTGVSTV
ncbi:hypothetical protein GCM10027085_57400 [Spirosoma aerophilum]